MLLMAVLLVAAAHAQANGDVGTYGAGTSSCGNWLEEKRKIDRGEFSASYYVGISWVQGYLSAWGVALAAADVKLKKTDSDAMAAFIENYCRENPLEDLLVASTELVMALKIDK